MNDFFYMQEARHSSYTRYSIRGLIIISLVYLSLNIVQWVSEWILFSAISVISQLYYDANKLHTYYAYNFRNLSQYTVLKTKSKQNLIIKPNPEIDLSLREFLPWLFVFLWLLYQVIDCNSTNNYNMFIERPPSVFQY